MGIQCVRTALDVSAATSELQRIVFLMANLCALLFRKSGHHVCHIASPVHIALAGDCTKAGLLAAALEMRSALLQTADGREALGYLGFQPLPENVEGE